MMMELWKLPNCCSMGLQEEFSFMNLCLEVAYSRTDEGMAGEREESWVEQWRVGVSSCDFLQSPKCHAERSSAFGQD